MFSMRSSGTGCCIERLSDHFRQSRAFSPLQTAMPWAMTALACTVAWCMRDGGESTASLRVLGTLLLWTGALAALPIAALAAIRTDSIERRASVSLAAALLFVGCIQALRGLIESGVLPGEHALDAATLRALGAVAGAFLIAFACFRARRPASKGDTGPPATNRLTAGTRFGSAAILALLLAQLVRVVPDARTGLPFLSDPRIGAAVAIVPLAAAAVFLRSCRLSDSSPRFVAALRLSLVPLTAHHALIAIGVADSGLNILILRTLEGMATVFPLLGIAQDSFEHLRAESAAVERLEIAQRVLSHRSWALEKSNDDLDAFASIASHDLQEPLRQIRSFGDLLRRRYADALDEKGTEYLDRMGHCMQRMQDLIKGLLDFSRAASENAPFVTVDLGNVVDDVLSDLEVRLRRSGGRVEVQDLPLVHGDPTQIRQLLQNLVSNAIKFHRPDEPPLVEVESIVVDSSKLPESDPAADMNFCRLTVRDNGIGFDEKHLDRIFGIFQRLNGRSQYQGTGVGLAVCRRIVQRHGGTITAQSSVGNGATFVVTLPLADGESVFASEGEPSTVSSNKPW